VDEESFRDREDLMREIQELRQQLNAEREENVFLRGLLSERYKEQPGTAEKLEFPIPEQAIDLFEELPDTFTLDDAFAAAERQGLSVDDVAANVRVYLDEEMVVQEGGGQRFVKTGRKPYF
jgi:predicted nuclease with TOPRIM domain